MRRTGVTLAVHFGPYKDIVMDTSSSNSYLFSTIKFQCISYTELPGAMFLVLHSAINLHCILQHPSACCICMSQRLFCSTLLVLLHSFAKKQEIKNRKTLTTSRPCAHKSTPQCACPCLSSPKMVWGEWGTK